jgi:hypothetical protein
MLHVDIPTRAEIEWLLLTCQPGCVSIYLPTSPLTDQAQADRIALKNLTTEAIGQLADHDKREVRAIEEALFDVIDDDAFWEVQANSLALFLTANGLRTFRLPSRLKPVVEVSDRFHVKPLLRVMSVPQSAYVLALSQNAARVVEVSADLPAHTLKVDGLPSDAASAAGKASIKDRSPSGRIQGSEGIKVRLAQFCRKIDLALRNLLAGRETPLILAAAEPLLSIYRTVNSYHHLTTSVIPGNAETLSDAELAAAARAILDEQFGLELSKLRAEYQQRLSQQRTTADIAQAARAATRGAVQTLLVDIDNVVPGTMDDDGAVTFAKTADASNYGLVDEIARRALLSGARVLGVRRADVPGGGSLAAILRYPC